MKYASELEREVAVAARKYYANSVATLIGFPTETSKYTYADRAWKWACKDCDVNHVKPTKTQYGWVRPSSS